MLVRPSRVRLSYGAVLWQEAYDPPMRRTNSGLAFALCLAVAALATTGCRSQVRRGTPGEIPVRGMAPDRGDWLVGRHEKIYRVLEESATGAAAKHVGYLVERSYREVRGGPAFTHWEVTTLDRHEVIGTVDALGNAVRIKPGIAGDLDFVPVGNNTLPLGVQAIFDTMRPVRLEETSERSIAFALLDKNHDGALDATEFPRLKDRVGGPDRNGDGTVDRNEFEDADL